MHGLIFDKGFGAISNTHPTPLLDTRLLKSEEKGGKM
jgi:hypothetical protein